MMGWAVPLEGVADPVEWMTMWTTHHVHLPTRTPDPARSLKLTDLCIEILRDETPEGALPDRLRAGVWNLVSYQANQRTEAALHQLRSGVLDLALKEMRMAATTEEWMSAKSDPLGRYTSTVFAIFHIGLGVCKVGDSQIEKALRQTDGLFDLLLDILLAYEAHPDPAACSAILVNVTGFLMASTSYYSIESFAARMLEASSAFQFLLEHERDWLSPVGMNSTAQGAVSIACELFGREESADATIELTQAHVDTAIGFPLHLMDPNFFGGMYPAFHHTARPILSVSVSDYHKPLLLKSPGCLKLLTSGLFNDENHPKGLKDPHAPTSEESQATWQTICTQSILQLALWVPHGRDALLADADLCAELRIVVERPKAKEAHDSARAALSALGLIDTGSQTRQAIRDSSAVSTKHVMMSYQWSAQATVKRVVHKLKTRAFLIWWDLENMKGVSERHIRVQRVIYLDLFCSPL
jgi:hypothetical protein